MADQNNVLQHFVYGKYVVKAIYHLETQLSRSVFDQNYMYIYIYIYICASVCVLHN